jgi:hypothetical protein
MIPTAPTAAPRTVEQQVWDVADVVTEIIRRGCTKPHVIEKENYQNAK